MKSFRLNNPSLKYQGLHHQVAKITEL